MSNLSCSSENLSREFVTEALWVLEGEVRINGLVTAIVLIFIVLAGLPFNGFIIGSIFKHKLYRQQSFIPLLNLAISNLLICLLVLPMNIVSGIAGSFPFGNSDFTRCVVCQLASIHTTLLFASIFSVTLISVDMFIFIKFALRYEHLVTVKRMSVALVAVWLVCIVIGILPMLRFGRLYFSSYIANCTVAFSESKFYLLLLLAVLVPNIFVLFFTNIWILCILQKHLRKIYMLYKSDPGRGQLVKKLNDSIKSKRKRKQLNIIRVFGAIFFVNIFTFLPVIVLFLASATVGLDEVPLGYTAFSYLLLVFQSVLHPLLESTIMSELKSPFLALWHNNMHCCFRPALESSTGTLEIATSTDSADNAGTLLCPRWCVCGLCGACSAAILSDLAITADVTPA